MVHLGEGLEYVIDGPVLEEVVGQGLRVGQVQTSQILEFIDEDISYLDHQLLSLWGEKEKESPSFALNVEILEPLGG